MTEPWKYAPRFPASEKQIAYLKSLAAERRIDLDRGLRLRWGCDLDDLDGTMTSTAIDIVKREGGLIPMYQTVREGGGKDDDEDHAG